MKIVVTLKKETPRIHIHPASMMEFVYDGKWLKISEGLGAKKTYFYPIHNIAGITTEAE